MTPLTSLAFLYGLAVLSRALLLTVLPLQAYDLLGSTQRVSFVYFAVSLASMAAFLFLPVLARRVRRRGLLLLGPLCLIGACGLFATAAIPSFVIGLGFQMLGLALTEMVISLYVMDHLPRDQFLRFEALRAFFASCTFTIGPWLGVRLQHDVAWSLPYLLSAAAAVSLVVLAWRLRLSDSGPCRSALKPAANPLVYIPRFFRQPRLRLSYLLAVGRSGWWSMFFVYAPLFAISSGLSETTSGAIVSIGLAWLLLVPAWGRIARIFGVRRLLIAGYGLAGICTIIAGIEMSAPWFGIGMLVAAALAAATLDGAGNVHFLRAVRPRERTEMAAVFGTYRDAGQTLPPGVFTVLLTAFDVRIVFIASGAAMALLALYSRFLPRRL
ncbi:MFS transporter [Virgifigura deserti]|uniref:MFS transporter n=1 Tax=Virgifigura deserti TaxID=2268457 RepID=UPI003CCC2496